MTVVMILMSLHSIVDNGIVQQVGNVVQASRIIVAFRNGYSVTVKMIVVTIVMNYQKIAQFVAVKPISNVRTIDAYQSKI